MYLIAMNQPHLNFEDLKQNHLRIPITDINLCVNFAPQGICDEQHELAVRPMGRQRHHEEPPRANHFSLWMGFGAGCDEIVMLDVTQAFVPSNPLASNVVKTRHLLAVVRLASKTNPTDDDIGCVLRELHVRPGTTVEDIVQVILAKDRHRYCFSPEYRQQAGCRYWIHVISQDLEELGLVGKGFADDVLEFLQVYHGRYPCKLPNGRWGRGGNWGPRKEFQCAPIVSGSFY